jgi:hypothetical protein
MVHLFVTCLYWSNQGHWCLLHTSSPSPCIIRGQCMWFDVHLYTTAPLARPCTVTLLLHRPSIRMLSQPLFHISHGRFLHPHTSTHAKWGLNASAGPFSAKIKLNSSRLDCLSDKVRTAPWSSHTEYILCMALSIELMQCLLIPAHL